MKKLVIVLLVCLLLAVTNPTMDNFLNWAAEQVEEDANSDLEAFLGGMLAKPALQLSTERKDYIIFSIYIVEKPKEDSVILGIAKQFIRIK